MTLKSLKNLACFIAKTRRGWVNRLRAPYLCSPGKLLKGGWGKLAWKAGDDVTGEKKRPMLQVRSVFSH